MKQGETLYSISKSYNLTVDAVKTLNNLVSNSVKDGQKLLISNSTTNVGDSSPRATQVSPIPVKPEINQEIKQEKANAAAAKPIKIETPPTPPPATTNNFERATKTISPIKKANGGKTLMQVTETGVAAWLQDGQINQDKYYGLHRSAPIGTIMKVTNRMNNQFVYVKIVGVLPATGDNDNLIIKVSQAVSSKLNALDSLFQVELSYGVMQ